MKYLLQDGLQSLRGMSDGNDMLSAQAYSPYGEPMFTDMPTEFGFTGEQTDPLNDLVYLRARYLNPRWGVFGSLDAFEGDESEPLTWNGYGWVEGNTPNLTDASGMSTGTCNTPSTTLSPISQQCKDVSMWGPCLIDKKGGGGGGGGGLAIPFIKWIMDIWGATNTIQSITATMGSIGSNDQPTDYSQYKSALERMGRVVRDVWNVTQFADNAQSQAYPTYTTQAERDKGECGQEGSDPWKEEVRKREDAKGSACKTAFNNGCSRDALQRSKNAGISIDIGEILRRRSLFQECGRSRNEVQKCYSVDDSLNPDSIYDHRDAFEQTVNGMKKCDEALNIVQRGLDPIKAKNWK